MKRMATNKKTSAFIQLLFLLIVVAIISLGCSIDREQGADASTEMTISETQATTQSQENAPIEKLDSDKGGFIVFENEANGDYNFEVYIMNGDGTAITQLTNSPGYDGSPSLSPELSKIAFASAQDGNVNLYTFDLDAYLAGKDSPAIKLTNEGNNYVPVWSPDGSTLLFQSDRDGSYKLYQMDADGANQRLLIDMSNAFYPSFSPDGQMIAFSASVDGNNEIFTITRDGKDLKQLTDIPGDNQFASWSPDGLKIAFSNLSNSTNFDIWTMDASGENPIRLIDHLGLDEFPKWSPDGKQILFRSAISGSDQLTIMNADGSGAKALIQMKGMSMPYDWKSRK